MEPWHSPRYWQEQRDKQLVQLFDDFIDLALEGTISLEQAICGIKEVIATEAEVETKVA